MRVPVVYSFQEVFQYLVLIFYHQEEKNQNSDNNINNGITDINNNNENSPYITKGYFLKEIKYETKPAVSDIERGRNNVTEQTIRAICREFSVRESWLRTGEGEPFIQLSRDEEIENFVKEILKEKPEAFRRRFVSTMAALDVEEWEMIEKILKELYEGQIAQKEAAPSAGTSGNAEVPTTVSDLTPKEKELIRQFREKKNQAGEASASSAG